MDDEAVAMRNEIDRTMADLSHKLGELEQQVVGTVKTVKDSVNTVRNNFDLRYQLRRRPWTFVSGAAAVGFLGGFTTGRSRPGAAPRYDTGVTSPEPRATAPACLYSASNGTTNSSDAASNWLARFGGTFEPELAELKGIVIGTLLGIAREIIVREACRSSDRPASYADNGSCCSETIDPKDIERLTSVPQTGEN